VAPDSSHNLTQLSDDGFSLNARFVTDMYYVGVCYVYATMIMRLSHHQGIPSIPTPIQRVLLHSVWGYTAGQFVDPGCMHIYRICTPCVNYNHVRRNGASKPTRVLHICTSTRPDWQVVMTSSRQGRLVLNPPQFHIACHLVFDSRLGTYPKVARSLKTPSIQTREPVELLMSTKALSTHVLP
jgi:hypothetical protein